MCKALKLKKCQFLLPLRSLSYSARGQAIYKVSITIFLRFKVVLKLQHIWSYFISPQTCELYYFASIASTDNRYRAIHSRHLHSCVNKNSVIDRRRRSQRIAAIIAKRSTDALSRTIHPPTRAEDVE